MYFKYPKVLEGLNKLDKVNRVLNVLILDQKTMIVRIKSDDPDEIKKMRELIKAVL